MNQEFEQRVNQIILEQNLLPSEAAEIAQKQLAEEEVKKKENGDENTDSSSSDGTFKSIDKPQVPLTQWQKEQLEATPEWEEDILSIRTSAKDQEEADALNTEYQLDVDRYNAERQQELEKLVNKLSYISDEEESASLMSDFIQQTGLEVDEEMSSFIYEQANEFKQQREQFKEEEAEARARSQEQGDFVHLESFYLGQGFPEEEIRKIEAQFDTDLIVKEAYQFSKNPEEFSDRLNSVFLNMEAEATTEEQKAELQKRKDSIVQDFTESYNERGDRLMQDAKSGVKEMTKKRNDRRREIRKIQKSVGEEAVKMYRQSDTEYLQEPGLVEQLKEMEMLEMEADKLDSSIKASREANKTLKDIFKKYPEAEAVLPIIASAHRPMIDAMHPSVRDEYFEGGMSRDEALRQSYILSMYQDEYSETLGRGRINNLYMDGVVVIPVAEVYGVTGESEGIKKEEYGVNFFTGREEFLGAPDQADAFVEEQNRVLKEYYKDVLPELTRNMTEEDKKDFEEAVSSFTGLPLDLDGDDWVGGGYQLNGLKFLGSMWDLGGTLFEQAPRQLGRWLDYQVAMSKADSDEERLAIKKKDSERADLIEFQGNWGGMEWANSFGAVAAEGKGAWQSFKEGNWASGFTKTGNMVFEMAPVTLVAMGTSFLSGGSAAPGAFLFYTNAMVSTYNHVRNLDWYKDKSPLWRGLFLNGTALLEAATEQIGTKAQLRILKGGGPRALGQTRLNYVGKSALNQGIETSIETASELTNTLGAGLFEYSMGGEGVTGEEIAETFIGSVALSGSTAAVGKAKRQASAILSNNSIDAVGLSGYFQKEIDSILKETEPNTKARELSLSAIFEEMNSLSALNVDTYELHEYIAGVDEASAQKLVANSVELFSVLKSLEAPNLSRKDKESLKIKAENLAKERLEIEQKYISSFAVDVAVNQTPAERQTSLFALNERASIFEKQAEVLESKGLNAQAESMRGRAQAIRDRVRTQETISEVEYAIENDRVVTSEGNDVNQIVDILDSQDVAFVDGTVAEALERRGWSEAKFAGSKDGKVLMIKEDGLKLGQDDLTLEQVKREVRVKQNIKGSEGTPQLDEKVASLIGPSLRGAGGNIENLTTYEQELYESLSEQGKARAKEISERKESDLDLNQNEDVVDNDSSILVEEAQSTFDDLSKRLGGALGDNVTVRVVKESVAFAMARQRLLKDLSEATSEQAKQEINSKIDDLTQNYLDGRSVIGGSYAGGEMIITDKATAKDVVEEFAHALIDKHFSDAGKKKSARQFKNSLEAILKKDPTLKQHIAAKEAFYREQGFRGVALQEELLVEAISRMATSKPSSFLQSTINSINSLFSGEIPSFFKSGGDVFAVFEKLSNTLSDRSSTAEDIKTAFQEAIPTEQLESAEDIENARTDEEARAVQNSMRRPTFLDEKVITFTVLSINKFTGHSKSIGTRQVKINDYYHFVNWYRKMTGNGRFTRIGSMTYIDANGNQKQLNPPKPKLDANGEPVWMEPAMKSFEQREIDRNIRAAEERKEKRLREALASNEITNIASRIQPIISSTLRGESGFDLPTGNVSRMIRDLMSDFTIDGTPNESVLDENGQPTVEKVIGSDEYYTELQERVNEMMTDSYGAGTVFYSQRQLGDLLSNELTSEQKKKNFRLVYEIAKPFLSSRTQEQIEIFIDSNISLLPPLFAQQVFHAYNFSMMRDESGVEITPTGRKKLTKKQMESMAVVCAKELDEVNRFLGDKAKRFYSVFNEVGLGQLDENGNLIDGKGIQQAALSPNEDGVMVENEEKLILAREHQDLFVALIGVLSNGNRAVPNLTEATKLYNIILEDVLRDGKVGDRTKARLNKIENSNVITGVTTNRPKEIVTGLRVLLGLQDNKSFGVPYNFDNPGEFKQSFLKKESKGKIAGQRAYGSWNKIGAFIANLYKDFDILTQDRHLVNYIDARIRPGLARRFDSKAFRDFLYSKDENGNRIWSDSEIKKIRSEVGAEGRFYDMNLVKAWVARHISTKRESATARNSDKFKALSAFNEKHLRLEGGPINKRVEKENLDFVALVQKEMQKLTNHEGITVGQVMQIMFAANHLLPNAVGVSGRIYDDFGQETWDKVVERTSSASDYFLNEEQEAQAEYDSYAKSKKIEEAYGPDLTEEKLQAYRDRLSGEGQTLPESVTYYSTKKIQDLADHNLFRTFNVSELFQGRQVSVMSNVKFGVGKFNLNKLLEGRGSEAEIKGNVASYGKAEDAFVDGVVFMRHPLLSDSFVDSYGNVIKYAENAVVSGDALVAYGKVRYAQPVTQSSKDIVDISKPEHFVAFQNFVSILKQRNPSLSDADTEMFELAYSNMSSKERARFANLTIDEHGNVIKGRRLRGTSKRLASSSEFGRFKNEIINNPNNYIDQQKIANEQKALEQMSPQELVSLMRGDALNNLATRNDDVGVLAGIELINRMQEEGNDIGIVSVLDQLAAVGTTAGRVLRHMAELKTSTPQGMANVIIKKAQEQGKILSEAQKNKILEATKRYMDAYRTAQNLMERGIAGEDVEAEFKKAQDALDEAQRDLDTLANMFIEKKWSEIGVQLVQGNLLTMMSQARNVVYNLANVIPKTVIDLMSMPTSRAFELMGLHKEQRKLSLAGYLYAMRKFGAGAIEAIEQVITGREKDMSEWRMSRGFMPIRSLMAAMSSELPEGQSLRDEFNQRAKLLVQGTFGIPAEAMFRLLSLGDVPFRRFAEGLELYSLGRGKGLEGDALAQFLKFPDKDSMERSATEGRKLTFQEPMGLAKGSMWVIDNLSRGMGQAFSNVKGFDGEGFFKFLIRLNVPYVSTIANFTEETLTYASPVFGGGKMAIQMSNGEYTEASKTLSKVMVGQAVSSTALYLISQGLLSGSIDWEDDEKTNLMYDTFPPNSINVSGLRRLLNGEDPAPQAGDEFRSYQTLGVLGTIMGAYAHTTTPDAAKEMADQPLTANSVLKKLFGFDNASVVAYMMDQSFLQGLNGITSLIASTKDPDDFEKAFFKYVETISKACSSMFLPNVLSGIDQSTREFMPDKRDVDLMDRIKNHVKERTFNTGGLPVKVNWKGERIEQAPEGGNQFAYYMFDALKSRQASQDEVSIEILNLYLDTGVLPKAVGTPYYASSVYRKLNPPSVSRGKAKKAYEALGRPYNFLNNPEEDFFVRLTAEEINNALAMSNTLRYEDIKSFMQTDDYKSMTPNEKIEALDELNDRYKSLLSYNPDGSFMEHSKYILEVMEQRYLEQYGQD